jgi:two-component system sensor histidine kinase VanS
METNTILKKIYKRTLLQYIAYTVGLLVVFVLAVYLAAFLIFNGSMILILIFIRF